MAARVDLSNLQSGQSHGSGGGAGVAPVSAAKQAKKFDNSSDGWSVPELKRGFDLQYAVDRAYGKAQGYLNGMLEESGMYVEMQQGDAGMQGVVKEMDTETIVKAYDGEDMLRLYAHNHQLRGVVVDGQV